MISRLHAYVAAAAIVALTTTSTAQAQSKTPAHRASKDEPAAYTPPRGKKMFNPGFPDELRTAGQEGWVLLTFMVDRKGKAYEIAVVDSNGFAALEQAAVKVMDRAEYRPATLGTKRIDSAHRMTFTFMLEERKPLSVEFRDLHNPASEAIGKGERQRADDLLASIKALSLNEDAILNMLRYQYAKKWGTPAQQLDVLRRASGFQDPNVFLHSSMIEHALRARLELQLQLNDFGGALTTWELIGKEKKTEAFAPTFQAAIDDINVRRTDDRSHTLAGDIDHRGSWFVRLLKRKFAIDAPSGKVSRLNLRCERGYFWHEFVAGKEYETDEDAGQCQLQVVGEAGTAVELKQS